jgi:hypothetical protein
MGYFSRGRKAAVVFRNPADPGLPALAEVAISDTF